VKKDERELFEEWVRWRRDRVHSAKKWLHYLPRRSTFRKHRGLGWFSRFALKRSYLWSFKPRQVIPAFYAGWILTCLPILGLHVIVACLLALLLRANVMILVALQMISNPLVIGLMWPFEYKVGLFFLRWMDPQNHWALQGTVREVLGGHSCHRGAGALKVVLAICVGGVVVGYVCALLSSLFYRWILGHRVRTYEDFVRYRQKKRGVQK
jgi:uncharacterized protein (DUF2062 family)